VIVETRCELVWRVAGDMVTMPRGEQLELVERGNNGDDARLAGWLPVEWMGARRWLHVSTVRALDADAAERVVDAREAARRAEARAQQDERRRSERERAIEGASERMRAWVEAVCRRSPRRSGEERAA